MAETDKFQKNKYVKVPKNTFKNLIKGSGIVLKNFDLENLSYEDSDFLCATSGGIGIKSSIEITDNGEGIDNVRKNTKELAELKSRTHEISFTSITANKDMLKKLNVAADWDSEDERKLRLRNYLEYSDFTPLYIVYGKANGGALVAHYPDLLATGGLDFKSANDGKGTFTCTFTAYSSLLAQDYDAVEYYMFDPPEEEDGGEVETQSDVDNYLYNESENENE